MEHNAIEVRGLYKSFGDNAVLGGVDFVAEKGKILSLLGPNGAGKTTIIRILSTLIHFDAGEVLVNGYDVRKEGHEVRGSIGLTGQFSAVDGYLTGFENLQMIGNLYHLGASEAKKRSHELIERFDMIEDQNRPVSTYSGGMKRKIDLAMSLIARPAILFLDEPTIGLDPQSRITMWEIIKELTAQGVTIFLTTQYMEEADYLSDRIIVLDAGKIIAEGTPKELKARMGSERLELSIHKSGDLEKARLALDPDAVHVDPKRRVLSVATSGGVKELRAILNKLDNAGIEVENLSLHQPTLDDVFLSLTGHATAGQESTTI